MNTLTLEDVLRNTARKLGEIRMPVRERDAMLAIQDCISDLAACIDAIQMHDKKMQEQTAVQPEEVEVKAEVEDGQSEA